MAEHTENAETDADEKPRHGLGERIREHLRAAEVAAEEAAGYGFVTETVEAAEAAVNPDHELGTHERKAKREEQPTGGDPPGESAPD